MRVWLACFFVLFALAEFFDWVKDLSLPLPIYILGGAFLAVVSNYDKIVGSYFGEVQAEILPEPSKLDTSTPSTPISSTISSNPIAVTMLTPVEEVNKPSQE
ncbi:hypothetical protein [Sphaerospermopsis torques-reginae]|uniref:Uncharacterized protein n=1 Tax=Sphaerospermopsis torques-reginae ITEP-024 TaxID=984208 RepID=A0ABX8X1J7_9CYAN|nr:hypothetical protein [Sphaerospermopsis torques-reginae]QYX32561.1 hypothetical protein K2F26_04010 [Sphaerospermopsis torques-reginae ITEP-024]